MYGPVLVVSWKACIFPSLHSFHWYSLSGHCLSLQFAVPSVSTEGNIELHPIVVAHFQVWSTDEHIVRYATLKREVPRLWKAVIDLRRPACIYVPGNVVFWRVGIGGVPRNFFRRGVNKFSWGQGRENRGLGGGSPLVRGSAQFANKWSLYFY
jgi:hypothetical protein